jgi:hemerythrin-like domain-containing protein
MEQKGFSREFGPLAVMLHEHDEGRSYVRGMLGALEAYEAGNADSIPALAENARAFIDLLRRHIMKEDNVLFVMADRQFTEQEQQLLSKEFTRVELTGEACVHKAALLALLDRLEQEAKQILASSTVGC